jgi:hypothetical protein
MFDVFHAEISVLADVLDRFEGQTNETGIFTIDGYYELGVVGEIELVLLAGPSRNSAK